MEEGGLAMRLAMMILAGCCVLLGCGPELEVETIESPVGSILWSYETDGEIWAPLASKGDVVYFGSDTGVFHALDVSTQELKWQFTAGGRIRSAAEIAGDIVLFASDDGLVYALGRDSGDVQWTFDLGSGEMERRLPATDPPYEYDYLQSSPVVRDGVVYVGSANANLYAIDLETGRERWHFGTGAKIRSSPTVSGGAVYVGSWDGHIYALEAATGQEVWRFDTGAPVQGSPAVSQGRVIVGSRSAKVFGLNAASGAVEWTHVHEDGSWVESSPVVRGNVVYIGSSDALKLAALEASSGSELWHFRTGGWSWSTPLVTDEVVYIGSISASPYYFEGVDLEAGFFAVDRETGRERWRLTPKPIDGYITGGVFSTAAIIGDAVYVASLDGKIYAVKE